MDNKKLPQAVFWIQFLVVLSFCSITILNLIPLYFEHLGGEPKQIGFLVGLFPLASFLARPFGGWILSRFNPKKILIAGLALQFAMTSLYPLITKLNLFVIFIRFFHGVGLSLFILASLYIAVLVVREDQKAYALGVVSSGFMLPLIIMPFLGEEIIVRFGFFSFFLAAIILAFIPVVISFFARLDIEQDRDENLIRGSGFLRLLGRKKIFLIIILAFLFEIALSASLSFVPLLAHEDTPLMAGFFYTLIGAMAVAMRLYGGKKIRVWGSPKLVAPSFFLIVLGGIVLHLSESNWLLAASGFLWGIGAGILYPHLSSLIIDRERKNERSKILSLYASSVDLGFAMGPIIFGLVSQTIGVKTAFLPFSLMILVLSFLVMGIGRKTLRML